MYLQVDRKTKIITLNPIFYSKYPLFLRKKKIKIESQTSLKVQTTKYQTFTENLEKTDVPKLEDKRFGKFLSSPLKYTNLSCFALNIKVRSMKMENSMLYYEFLNMV